MCIFSTCGQMIYGLLMVACLALTAVATFTSSWAEVKDLKHGPHTGIMPFACVTSSSGMTCHDWWQNAETWLRAVAVMMCLAMCIEIIALAWNLFTCFACCCKKWLIHPLSLFALLTTLLLMVSVIVYGVNHHNAIIGFPKGTVQLGWSFWIAVGALAVAAADTLVGAFTVFLGRHHL